jgi:DNA-binding NarL/FixJ family response regulator
MFFLEIRSTSRHTQAMTTTVLVLEDDDFTRINLVSTLTLNGLSVVAGCKTAAEAIAEHSKWVPAAALLDLDLGRGPTGLDVAQALRRTNPAVGIVFLTSYRDPRLIATPGTLVPAGAQYLVKTSITSADILTRTIHTSLSARRVTQLAPSSVSDFGRLTSGQVETLRLVAEGFSNSEIAKKRSITERAVEQKIARIAMRLGIERDIDRNLRVSIARAYFREIGQWGSDNA